MINYKTNLLLEQNNSNKVNLFFGEAAKLYKDDLISYLSPSEIAQANQYKFEKDKKTYIVCRAFLKNILSSHLDIKPIKIDLQYGVNGKPYINGLDYYFNVSHTNGNFVISTTSLGKIGVDIEEENRIFDYNKLINVILTESEKAYFNQLDKERKPKAFLRYWTTKEAFFKGVGSGLTSPLKELEINFTSNLEPEIRETKWSLNEKNNWKLFNLPTIKNLMGTIAVKNGVKDTEIQYSILDNKFLKNDSRLYE